MATDQGKTSNVAGHAMMAALCGVDIARAGTTVFRPPYTPVAIGALAGHHRGKDFRPYRLTPSHDWAQEQGAVFVETGLWLRAQYFPQPADTDWLDAVIREVNAVRSGVGVCDVSTLGKIDIQGADAAEFLNRVYINGWTNLAVGKARYGLMLREDGFVMDDGTTARLADTHFVMTTTTANAGAGDAASRILSSGAVALARCPDGVGHRAMGAILRSPDRASRDVLRGVVDPEHDISNEAFPYLASRSCDGRRRHRGAAVPDFVLGRTCLRACGAGVVRRRGDPRDHGGWKAVRHPSLRHRSARRDADREGPCRRQRTERADHGARSRARNA